MGFRLVYFRCQKHISFLFFIDKPLSLGYLYDENVIGYSGELNCVELE